MIRHATHADIPVMQGIVLEFFPDGALDGTGLSMDPDTVEFLLQDAIDREDYVLLVAEKDGMIIGGIVGGLAPWMFNANILTLMELGWFIPKRHRGRYPMAAMSLRKRFHAWGKEHGATVLCMVSTVREESPRVIEMYKKSGLIHMDNNFIGRL